MYVKKHSNSAMLRTNDSFSNKTTIHHTTDTFWKYEGNKNDEFWNLGNKKLRTIIFGNLLGTASADI